MIAVPKNVMAAVEEVLATTFPPGSERNAYRKWIRYYWDFCHKYGHPVAGRQSVDAFIAKLAGKRQSPAQQQQATQAVGLLLREQDSGRQRTAEAEERAGQDGALAERDGPRRVSALTDGEGSRPTPPATPAPLPRTGPVPDRRSCPDQEQQAPGNASGVGDTGRVAARPRRPAAVAHPPNAGAASVATGVSWQAEFAELAGAIQRRNYSPKTLSAYRSWTAKFQTFTRSKAPASLTTEDVKAFLTHLATEKHVAASTQNQAFNALLFLFRHVLGREFGQVDGVVRAKRRRYIPVVLSPAEVDRILAALSPPYDLIVGVLYGCGLRISECLELRVHCLNLELDVVTVHDGKGQKDRTVPLPASLKPAIEMHVQELNELLQRDLAAGFAGAFLPQRLAEKKYRAAARELAWQWFFPAATLTQVRDRNELRRYHAYPEHVAGAIKKAARQVGIPKRVTPHTFRHSYASHLLQANVDIRTIQELLGHSDVTTTMIYTHTVPSSTRKDAVSPLDLRG